MGNKADVWMPLYVGDYLADTQHLTCEQHGAYFLLMMFYWRHGSLPNDDGQLASIAKISAHKWKKISQIIRKFFHENGNELRHKRIDKELTEAAENKEKRTEVARKAAAARWAESNASSMPDALPGECPSPSPISSEVSNDTSSGGAQAPDDDPPKPKKSKRGTRLPEDWTLPDDDLAWALGEGLTVIEAEHTAAQFRDYWIAKSGKDATKCNWSATWRNWVRRDLGNRGSCGQAASPDKPKGGGGLGFAGVVIETTGVRQ